MFIQSNSAIVCNTVSENHSEEKPQLKITKEKYGYFMHAWLEKVQILIFYFEGYVVNWNILIF